ncbi:MAG: Rieske (2Fe-2S) protein [bacterium]|nr:Rieske (2Fe-2S) protein [bacterium]
MNRKHTETNAAGDSEQNQPASLTESPRFAPPRTRRDFLGLAAIWTAVGACAAAVVGAMRLPMPAVFPESNPKVKLGPPDQFKIGSPSYRPDLSLWVVRDDAGLYAISTVCTHLGCIATREEDGSFSCPCHGSEFTAEGKVTGGPAPKGLNWLALSLSPDGQLVVDKVNTVKAGARFQV